MHERTLNARPAFAGRRQKVEVLEVELVRRRQIHDAKTLAAWLLWKTGAACR
jgi:hypothetical protein